jgi:hypothetical protein
MSDRKSSKSSPPLSEHGQMNNHEQEHIRSLSNPGV